MIFLEVFREIAGPKFILDLIYSDDEDWRASSLQVSPFINNSILSYPLNQS